MVENMLNRSVVMSTSIFRDRANFEFDFSFRRVMRFNWYINFWLNDGTYTYVRAGQFYKDGNIISRHVIKKLKTRSCASKPSAIDLTTCNIVMVETHGYPFKVH